VEQVTGAPREVRPRAISAATYAATPLAIGAILWLHHTGYVAKTPLWVVFAILLGTAPLNLLAAAWLAKRPRSTARLHLRAMSTALTTAAVTYSLGWGALLLVAFAVGAAEVQRTGGSRTARPHALWALLAVAAGEVAVQLRIAPTKISPGLSHAVAIAGLCCLAIVMRVLENAAEQAEAAQEALRDRNAHFEALIEHASDVIGVLTGDGRIRSMSPAVQKILGYSPEEVHGRFIRDFVHPDDLDLVRVVVRRAVTGVEDASNVEMRVLHRDGSVRVLSATISVARAPEHDLIVNLHDITTQQALEDRLRHDASHDSLTGLLNRKAFGDFYESACSRAARHEWSVGLLYIDLDGFKEINDSFGHNIGDAVLVEAGRRMSACTRGEEVVARLGGDEFAVLVESVAHEDEVVALAERILAELGRPILDLPPEIALGASIGIAVSADPGSSEGVTPGSEMTSLLTEADEAMYQAKRNGRSRWEMSTRRRQPEPSPLTS
jgi:diguanylate cyclase (GGDEF)-like protein/PAS domain S-box-containing protein